MKIKTWYLITAIGNIGFFLMMIVFAFVTRFEEFDYLEEQLHVLLVRILIILAVQVGWNITMYSIPKFVPVPTPPKTNK